MTRTRKQGTKAKVRKNTSGSSQKAFQLLLKNSKFLGFVFAFAVLGGLHVWFRMQGVEQDYKLNQLTQEYKKINLQNKELKAIKAKNLSAKNLRKIANRFEMKEPDQHQIIIIPE